MGLYTRNIFSSFTSTSSWFELYAAFSTLMVLFRTAINELMPPQIRLFVTSKLKAFINSQSNNVISLKINQFWDENSGHSNQLFSAAQDYLPTKIVRTFKSLKVGKQENQKHLDLAVDASEDVVDEFEGTKYTWKLIQGSEQDANCSMRQCSFVLTFNEKNRERVFDRYIPHLLKTYEARKVEKKVVKIFARLNGQWKEDELSHPATFDTLALDPELKKDIMDDLERFLGRKELYKKVGKPWKRGYLLYGPPGTGKSSLIAAIANYLKFDVYDLDLSSVYSDLDLMRAMRDACNRSIIVIEDVDCHQAVHVRPKSSFHYIGAFGSYPNYSDYLEDDSAKVTKKFSLSSLLNNMDGLRLSGGEERIVIFTTNHKEKLDPALLRPGRMDMHIHLSFLKGKAFRVLASNYLGIEGDHPLSEQIEELLEKKDVTPAVVAEYLIRNEDPDLALETLVEFLKETSKDSAPVECQLSGDQVNHLGPFKTFEV